MPKFDRYLLSQLTVLFGFFALVLVSVYWVNRAVRLFDRLIGDGQSAIVFLEFTALALPNVISQVLPVAAFAAAIYATNRLSSDSELVVVQATGYSAFRLARPVVMFGILVAILLLLINNFLVPQSRAQLAERQAEVADDVTARLLSEGQFLTPVKGVTFYIREINAGGELLDVFLSDERSEGRQTTYTAERALLLPGDHGPRLVMFDGMVQNLSGDPQRLAVTRFSESVFDVATLINVAKARNPSIKELPTLTLLRPSAALLTQLDRPAYQLALEAHTRLAEPLLSIAGALIGFAALMSGSFSRFGTWRQVLTAIGMLIVLKLIDNSLIGAANDGAGRWPLLYVAPVLGVVLAGAVLWRIDHPRAGRRKAVAG